MNARIPLISVSQQPVSGTGWRTPWPQRQAPIRRAVPFSGAIFTVDDLPSKRVAQKRAQSVRAETTIGLALMHWLQRAYPLPAGEQTLTLTTSMDELATRLKDHISSSRQHFEYLLPQDLDDPKLGVLKKLTAQNTRRALLDQRNIPIEARDPAQPHLAFEDLDYPEIRITLTLPQSAQNKPQSFNKAYYRHLEKLLFDNLPAYKQLGRRIAHQIKQGQYAPGDAIPINLTQAGKAQANETPSTVDRSLRQKALQEVIQTTGRLKIARQTLERDGRQGHLSDAVFEVTEPGSSEIPAPKLKLAFTCIVPVLYHLAIHHANRLKGQQLPSSTDLANEYGYDIPPFMRAKHELASDKYDRVLTYQDTSKVSDRQFVTTRRMTKAKLLALLNPFIHQYDRMVMSLLSNSTNTKRDGSRWGTLEELTRHFTYPEGMTETSQKASLSPMTMRLSNSPVPLIFRQKQGGQVVSWLNPALDYDRLRKRLNALQKDPKVVASSLLLNIPFPYLPSLVQAQVRHMPTLRFSPHNDHMDMEAGLSPLWHPSTFLPLNQPLAPLTTRGTEAIDLQKFSKQSLGLVQTIYPLDKLSQLEHDPKVCLTQTEFKPFEFLKTPLTHVGFRVEMPR